MVKWGINPIEVAKAVIYAIDNPKPKLRYLVGKDAEEFIEASRKLPEEDLFRKVAQNVINIEGQQPRQEKTNVAAQ